MQIRCPLCWAKASGERSSRARLELGLLALLGGMIGALGSLLLAFGTFSVVSAQGWNEMVFRFEPSAAGVFASLGLATSVGAVGGFLPALRAARMPLLGALRD